MLKHTLGLIGVVGTLAMIAACSAGGDSEGNGGGDSASGGASASGGGINVGGNGANNVGGLGSGGMAPIPMTACDEAMPCTEDEICAGGFCAPNLGPCSS